MPLNPAGTPRGCLEEFLDGVNSYVMRWYDSVQGRANGASDLPVGGFTGLFQLVSPFGPVPGYGSIDPFSGGYLGFQDSAGTFTLTETPNSYPTDDINTGTAPNIFGPLSIPEPSSVILLASGCGGIGALALVRWRLQAAVRPRDGARGACLIAASGIRLIER